MRSGIVLRGMRVFIKKRLPLKTVVCPWQQFYSPDNSLMPETTVLRRRQQFMPQKPIYAPGISFMAQTTVLCARQQFLAPDSSCMPLATVLCPRQHVMPQAAALCPRQ